MPSPKFKLFWPHTSSNIVMNIPCKHWRDCGVKGGGCCTIGAYNKPSFGVCLTACKKYEGSQSKRERFIQQLRRVHSTQRGHHKGCGKTVIVWWPPIRIGKWYWKGVRWFGVPYPKRLWYWLDSGFTGKLSDWPGCGCVVKLKAAWVAGKGWWKVVKNA